MPLEEYPAPVALWVLVGAALCASSEPLALTQVQRALSERTHGRSGLHMNVVRDVLQRLESDDLVVVGSAMLKGREVTTYALTPAGAAAIAAARTRIREAVGLD